MLVLEQEREYVTVMDKKIIAREGLVVIGTFLLVFIYLCLDNGAFDLDYLFEDVPKPFLMLYGSYLVVRFLIWSFHILKLKESKTFKNSIYVICILLCIVLCICVLLYSFNQYKSHEKEVLYDRMEEMTHWVSIMEVTNISREKYSDDENYQSLYNKLEVFDNEYEKVFGHSLYDWISVNGSYNKLSPDNFKIERKRRLEEVKAMNKYELDLLLAKCGHKYGILMSIDRDSYGLGFTNLKEDKLEKKKEDERLKKAIIEHFGKKK